MPKLGSAVNFNRNPNAERGQDMFLYLQTDLSAFLAFVLPGSSKELLSRIRE